MQKRFAIFCLGIIGLTSPTIAFAGEDNYVAITAIADAFVEENRPNANNGDSGFLQYEVAYTQQADILHPETALFCPQPTSQVMLKFDLSQVDFPIDKARISLHALAYPNDKPLPTLSASTEDWDEAAVSWQNRPIARADMATPAERQADSDTIVWNDDGDPSVSLAEWLEYRRHGDKMVTILLAAPQRAKCWPYPFESAGFVAQFADRSVADGPLLELSSAETNLPEPKPTAVQLSGFQSIGNSGRTNLICALMVALTALFIYHMDE